MLAQQTTASKNWRAKIAIVVALLGAILVAGSCETPPQLGDESVGTYKVGGRVSGLSGQLHLVLGLSELVTVHADGNFSFTSSLADGDTYEVTTLGQPSGQTCTVTNDSGIITGADVDTVVVECTDVPGPFTVSGTVSGLAGRLNLVLGNYEGLARVTEIIVVNSDGSFTFASELSNGDTYLVASLGQPDRQNCVVIDGAGEIVGADVTDVTVHCTDVPGTFTVGGTVSGLSGELHLVLGGSELITVSADGDFVFASSFSDGDGYEVTILGQPAGQACTLTNGSGTVAGAAVGDVVVECINIPGPFSVGGTVSGLSGELNLVLGGSELLAVSADGDFVFTSSFSDGDSYEATMLGQPVGQACTLANGSGTIDGADVNNLAVDCRNVPSADLRNLTTSAPEPLTPTFVSDGLGYAIDASVLLSGVQITPIAVDESATIVVNGSEVVASGDSSSVIELGLGVNLIAIQVVATNGATRDYFVEVTRGAKVIEQVAYGKASNPDPLDKFGISVAVSGDTVAVGTRFEDSNATGINGNQGGGATSSGAVYVFRRSAQTWSQEAYVKASNTDPGDEFGKSVSLSGDTLVVGAPIEDSSATGINGDQADNSLEASGAVYVFRRSGSTWSQEAYIKASTPSVADLFGESVALSGDTLAVGARFEDSNATGVGGDEADNSSSASGAVYVFRRLGANWSQEAYLKASNTDADDEFGGSVAVSGDTLAVGASGERSGATGIGSDEADNSSSDSGAVYVFRRSGSDWSQEAYLKASNTNQGDLFGSSVALSGDNLAVGAPSEDSIATGVGGDETDNSANRSGAAYVFRRSGAVWTQEAYLKPFDSNSFDAFGASVSLAGDIVAIGARGDDGNATGVGSDTAEDSNVTLASGAVYLFRRSATTWSQEAYVKASNTDRDDEFGGSVALSDGTLVVGAIFEDSGATGINGSQSDGIPFDSGAVYVFQ